MDLPKDKEARTSESLKSSERGGEFLWVELEKIGQNPSNPRKIFDKNQIEKLAQSIEKKGLLQALVLRRDPEHPDSFTLVAGERRFRALKQLGRTFVPAYVLKGKGDNDDLELALVENVQRKNLSPIEEARAFAQLIYSKKLTHEELGQSLGKDRSSISNYLRLLELPEEIQELIELGDLSVGHAKLLLKLPEAKDQKRFANQVVKNDLSIRQLDRLLNKKLEGGEDQNQTDGQDIDPNLSYLAEQLKTEFRTKVRFIGTKSKGVLEIAYYSQGELDRLLKELAPDLFS